MSSWKGRNAVAARLAYLIHISMTTHQGRPMPAFDKLAARLGVSEKTVRRDLQAMEEAYIPFEWPVRRTQ